VTQAPVKYVPMAVPSIGDEERAARPLAWNNHPPDAHGIRKAEVPR